MRNFEYFEPKEIGFALALLAQWRGKARILAGGTDLVPQMRRGLVAPDALVSLRRVPGLTHMKTIEEGTRIGTLVTLGTLENSPVLASRYPALQTAVSRLASKSIRNTGTLGGNVCLDTKCIYRDQSQTWRRALPPCFKLGGARCYVVPSGNICQASFAADTVPVLIALNGRARVASSKGVQLRAIDSLYTGNGAHPLALNSEEILTEILLPHMPSGARCGYFRFSFRRAIDFPLVSIAIYLENRKGLCTDARVVLGAVAPRPLRLAETEADLKQAELNERLLRHCSLKASREVSRVSKSGRMNAFTKKIVEQLVYHGLREVSKSF